ncbi:MAG: hypothetical protein NC399_01175 [Muribaculum sp.]|nr:hypothetical protein [Muribaculum sp.]
MNRRLVFYPELYLGEGIKEKKLDKIKRRLIQKPLLAGVHLIVLARNPDDQLEILDARQLAQRYYESHALDVVGIAGDYEDALQLVERMTQECLDRRGDCKLKEYLTC